jgi:hypothetical protein
LDARLLAAELDGREHVQAGFRELFFVREFVQAVRYLQGGGGKKLAGPSGLTS